MRFLAALLSTGVLLSCQTRDTSPKRQVGTAIGSPVGTQQAAQAVECTAISSNDGITAQVQNKCTRAMTFTIIWGTGTVAAHTAYRINAAQPTVPAKRNLRSLNTSAQIESEQDAGPLKNPTATVVVEDRDMGNGQVLSVLRNTHTSNHAYVEFTGRCWGKVVLMPGQLMRVCVRATGEKPNLSLTVAELEPD